VRYAVHSADAAQRDAVAVIDVVEVAVADEERRLEDDNRLLGQVHGGVVGEALDGACRRVRTAAIFRDGTLLQRERVECGEEVASGLRNGQMGLLLVADVLSRV
jgi:hypothetical protein